MIFKLFLNFFNWRTFYSSYKVCLLFQSRLPSSMFRSHHYNTNLWQSPASNTFYHETKLTILFHDRRYLFMKPVPLSWFLTVQLVSKLSGWMYTYSYLFYDEDNKYFFFDKMPYVYKKYLNILPKNMRHRCCPHF